MKAPGHPQIRLATEYGHIIGPAPAKKLTLTPPPAYGREPAYIPFEVAGRHEGPVHAVVLLTWKNAVDNKVMLAPYAEMTLSEIDGAALTFRSDAYAITIQGDNLMDWLFLDALVKHRVKSIREWNPALHNRPNAAQLCITRMTLDMYE
jgi:hypothetical protein